LTGHGPVLDGDVEALGAVDLLERGADPLHGQEQVRDLVRAQVVQARDHAPRTHEDVPGQQRLEIDDRERRHGAVEHLLRHEELREVHGGRRHRGDVGVVEEEGWCVGLRGLVVAAG